MRLGFTATCLLLAASVATPAPAAAPEPALIAIVGTFHMANPGHDLHNLAADDMLAPRRQTEIAAVTAGLQRLRPTRVAVEWPQAVTTERYAAYRAGTLAPSRNEVVQLGFRLAQASGLTSVDGIDVDGEFPYESVEAYAKQHGQSSLLEAAGSEVQAVVDEMGRRLAAGSVGGVLRFLNDPARLASDNAFYRTMLRIGGADAQPGVDLLTAWYQRNFRICARLLQSTRPGDRVVVFFGSGHALLLRQCVVETPGLRLVEPNEFLPP